MRTNSTTANVSPSAAGFEYSFVPSMESSGEAKDQKVADSDIDYVIDRYKEALRLLGE